MNATFWMDFDSAGDAFTLGYDQTVLPSITEPYRTALAALSEGHGCATCERPVGYQIEEEDDDYGTRMVGRWYWLTIAHDGNGKTWLLCEDCSMVLSGPVKA